MSVLFSLFICFDVLVGFLYLVLFDFDLDLLVLGFYFIMRAFVYYRLVLLCLICWLVVWRCWFCVSGYYDVIIVFWFSVVWLCLCWGLIVLWLVICFAFIWLCLYLFVGLSFAWLFALWDGVCLVFLLFSWFLSCVYYCFEFDFGFAWVLFTFWLFTGVVCLLFN